MVEKCGLGGVSVHGLVGGGVGKVEKFRFFSMVAKCHKMIGNGVKSVWECCLGCGMAYNVRFGCIAGCWGARVRCSV